MGLQRKLIQVLDRRGGRGLLGLLATRYARRATGLNCRVLYDGVWIHGVDGIYLADGVRFNYRAGEVVRWQARQADVLEMHRDWWFFKYQPRLGDVILDIGAGVGEDAVLFAQAVGATGRVVSVEAHPQTFRLLEKTVQWNRLGNVTPVHCAIADQRGELYIEDRSAHQANAVSAVRRPEQLTEAVGALTLDDFCTEHQVQEIDFLKMNIEGAERLAIRGMPRAVARTRHICIACHDFLGAQDRNNVTQELVMEFLRQSGFEICARPEHPEPWVRHHVHGWRK